MLQGMASALSAAETAAVSPTPSSAELTVSTIRRIGRSVAKPRACADATLENERNPFLFLEEAKRCRLRQSGERGVAGRAEDELVLAEQRIHPGQYLARLVNGL